MASGLIEEMAAGVELDAVVARLVMGVEGEPESVPPYSASIESAFEVVNALLGRKAPLNPWGDNERYFSLSYGLDGWEARLVENHWNDPFGPEGEPALIVEVEKQPTAALAICRMALKAMEGASGANGATHAYRT